MEFLWSVIFFSPIYVVCEFFGDNSLCKNFFLKSNSHMTLDFRKHLVHVFFFTIAPFALFFLAVFVVQEFFLESAQPPSEK